MLWLSYCKIEDKSRAAGRREETDVARLKMSESHTCLQISNRTDIEGKGIRNVNNLVLCDLLHNVIHLTIHRNALKMTCTCAGALCTAPCMSAGGEAEGMKTPLGTAERFLCQIPHTGLGQCPEMWLGQLTEIGMPFKSALSKEGAEKLHCTNLLRRMKSSICSASHTL